MKNLKKRAIYSFFLSFSLILNSYCSAGASNQGLGIGETIPNPEVNIVSNPNSDIKESVVRLHDYKEDKALIIAFMPTITNANNYAKIMTSAFDTYFAQGLSFRQFEQYSFSNPDLKVLIVTPDKADVLSNYIKQDNPQFELMSDADMNAANFFGITKWDNSSAGSYVYVVDKNDKIVYASYDYKGEGEKLKIVQNELYTMFGLKDEALTTETNYSPLVIGDKERDFKFKYVSLGKDNGANPEINDGTLSDYIGKKNVMIAFYPAAYSYSCSSEITAFNHYAEDRMLEKVKNSGINSDDLEILMVSVSNPYILSQWKNDLNLNNVKLVSDDGEISKKYSSFNSFGYNNRTIFLIDKIGNLSYVNWNYKVDSDDFALLKDNITALK